MSTYNKHYKLGLFRNRHDSNKGRCQNVYYASSLNSIKFASAKLKFPQIIRCNVCYRLIFKHKYITCAVLVTAWIKSMHKMKTTSHWVESKVKIISTRNAWQFGRAQRVGRAAQQ